MEESRNPENQTTVQASNQNDQAVATLKNPNRINYKLYWRLSRGVAAA